MTLEHRPGFKITTVAFVRPFQSVRLTEDHHLFKFPLVYHGALLKADGAGTATVEIYDGQNAGEEWKDSFRAAADEHDQHIFERGMEMSKGLFADLGANVDLFVVYFSMSD